MHTVFLCLRHSEVEELEKLKAGLQSPRGHFAIISSISGIPDPT